MEGVQTAESCCQVLCVWSLDGTSELLRGLVQVHIQWTIACPTEVPIPTKPQHTVAVWLTIKHDRILPPVFITPPSSYAIASFCMVMEKMMVALWWEVVVEIAAIANCSLLLAWYNHLALWSPQPFLSSLPSSLHKYMGEVQVPIWLTRFSFTGGIQFNFWVVTNP